MDNVPIGRPVRLNVVGRGGDPQPMVATYEGAGKPITIAPIGPPQQVWEITPAEGGGGYNIRALEVHDDLDQVFMRNEYTNSSVSLGERHFIRINQDQESPFHTISGPYRSGTYGANDWIGVFEGKLVTRSAHDVKQTNLESYLWYISPA